MHKLSPFEASNTSMQQLPAVDRGRAKRAADIGLRLLGSEGPLNIARNVALRNISLIDDPLILQVGANDGRFDDPVRSFLVNQQAPQAVLIEPQKKPFDKLQDLYSDYSDVQCFKVAIANSVGSLTLWHPEFGTEDDGFGTAIACSDPDQVQRIMRRHPLRRRREYSVEPETVPTKPLQDVLDESNFAHEDVTAFFCDAEGADIDITHQLLDMVQPPLIQYEHHVAPAESVSELNRRLLAADYSLVWSYRDVLALRGEALGI